MLCALSLAACRHAQPVPAVDAPAAPPDAAAAPPTVEATSAASDAGAHGELLAMADQLAARMSTLRGLPLLRPVQKGVMSRDQILARILARQREEYPPGEIELEGEALKRLGLIPESMAYERTMLDLLGEQVMGFYDPDEQTLYLADWVPVAAQAVTTAHEITHALQDQSHHIGRFLHHVEGNGDAQLAAMAVVEGDATVAMIDFTASVAGRRAWDVPHLADAIQEQQLAGPEQQRLLAAPRAMRDTLLFPYLSGLAFCARRIAGPGRMAEIDPFLDHPPTSTEQVLHPEKLDAHEAPIVVPATVPAALASEFALAYHDTMGEFGAREFFLTVLDEPRARAAAQGWGGDQAVLLVPRAGFSRSDAGVTLGDDALARDVMLWSVTLDAGATASDAEAVEFATAAVAVLNRRYIERPSVTVPGAQAARDLGRGRVALVARAGRNVLVADRVPLDRAAAVIRAVTAARTR